MKHCCDCDHFHQPFGELKGFCYGAPPEVYPSGMQQVNPPMVKPNRPTCHFFDALPAGENTHIKGKVDPETPGDAVKQAQATKIPIAVTFAKPTDDGAVTVGVKPVSAAAPVGNKKGRK